MLYLCFNSQSSVTKDLIYTWQFYLCGVRYLVMMFSFSCQPCFYPFPAPNYFLFLNLYLVTLEIGTRRQKITSTFCICYTWVIFILFSCLRKMKYLGLRILVIAWVLTAAETLPPQKETKRAEVKFFE